MFVRNQCIYTQINPAVSACQFKRGPKVQDNPSLINSLFFANNYQQKNDADSDFDAYYDADSDADYVY